MKESKRLNEFIERLNSLPINWIRKSYKIVGEGSSRLVIEYSKTIVIKLAKNKLGYAQNSTEWGIFTDYSNSYKQKYLSKLYDAFYSGDNLKILIARNYPKRLYNTSQIYKKRGMNNFLREIAYTYQFPYSEALKRPTCDLNSPSSYRKTDKDKVVLVDFGYNRNARLLATDRLVG